MNTMQNVLTRDNGLRPNNIGNSLFIPNLDKILTKGNLRKTFDIELRLGKIRKIAFIEDGHVRSAIIYFNNWYPTKFSIRVRDEITKNGYYEYPDTIVAGHYIPIQMQILCQKDAIQSAFQTDEISYQTPNLDTIADIVYRLEDEIDDLKNINSKLHKIVQNQQAILENFFSK